MPSWVLQKEVSLIKIQEKDTEGTIPCSNSEYLWILLTNSGMVYSFCALIFKFWTGSSVENVNIKPFSHPNTH